MAKVIVSGNLNFLGDDGAFESDRSTWGFADGADYVTTRSSAFAVEGLYSALLTNPSGGLSNQNIIPCAWPGVIGKKYLIRARIRTPAANPLGDDAEKFSFRPSLSNIYLGLTEIDYIERTVLESTDAWVEVESSVLANSSPFGPHYSIQLTGAVAGYAGGKLYVDKFEVYEYEDVDEEPPVCDVDIDEEATVVTNETAEGAADGSIEVEATGTGVLEYSKDGGANWQLSNIFAGLTTGIYVVRVRQQATISCYDEYPFALNFGAVTHDFTTEVTDESFAGLEDGSIAITPTGTGGPFEYSIDAGATFQAGNLFEDIAPGTYYVVVRNAAGNSVVHVVEVAAGSAEIDKTYHSKNPITLSKAAAPGWELLTNYRLYCDVRIEDEADSGVYESRLKVELPPDNTGNVVFYLREAFRDAFNLIAPTLNHNAIIRLTDRIKRFKNFTGELTADAVTPAELTPSSVNLVLLGGISKFHFPDLNYFTDYLSATKKFLTWAPVQKYVDRLQEDYLNFYCYGNFTTLQLRLKAYFDDATDQTEVVTELAGTGFTRLYQIPAGPANSGVLLIDPEKNVTHYELSLLDQDDQVISEVRTYYIDQVSHPLTRFFMFLNSLGAFEVLKFTGIATEKVSFAREVSQRFLPHNYSAIDGEFTVNQVMRQKQTNLSSGYIKNRLAKEWHEYLQDFIGSPVVYDVTDGQRFPVVITDGEHLTEDQNYERFIRVTTRDAYDNESFTPAEI